MSGRQTTQATLFALSLLALSAATAQETPDQPAIAPRMPDEPVRVVPVDPLPPELRRRPGEARKSAPLASEALPDPNRAGGLHAVAPVPRPDSELCETAACLAGDGRALQALPAAVPDRWHVLDGLGLVQEDWLDPYAQNTWKGDKPIEIDAAGNRRFLSLGATLNGITELRRIPARSDGGSLSQRFWNQNLIFSIDYQQGDTTFRPPDWDWRFSPVINSSYLTVQRPGSVNDPSSGGRGYRLDNWVGVQELFYDRHLRNVSVRYDFDSVRVGIQPISSDFRGFLFQDSQLAARLYGTRDGNRWQYNAIFIKRLEKDTNSTLNDVTRAPRADEIYLFNLYRQDWPVTGFTSQALIAHNSNREHGRFLDDGDRVARPSPLASGLSRNYETTYFGINGDGHFGRVNLTASATLVQGDQTRGAVTEGAEKILAGFAAAEVSIDDDWLRYRFSALYQSGDRPGDGTASGYDALYENPIFAGADTNFWTRQAVPFAGGTSLSTRNGLLNNLRTSKEHGQSNFENPGEVLAGFGVDADLTPTLRLSSNINHLWFDRSALLERVANRPVGHDIGWDFSTAAIWRPVATQNIILRLSGAWLVPGSGLRGAYPDSAGYSILGNFIFSY